MTVFQISKDMHMEVHRIDGIDLPDVAGSTDLPAVNLDRPGRFVAGFITFMTTTFTTNNEAVSMFTLFNSPIAVLNYGDVINAFIVRIQKQAGAGVTNIALDITLFIK